MHRPNGTIAVLGPNGETESIPWQAPATLFRPERLGFIEATSNEVCAAAVVPRAERSTTITAKALDEVNS
jgi:hypothetical protein